jgi:hypothetical protein
MPTSIRAIARASDAKRISAAKSVAVSVAGRRG